MKHAGEWTRTLAGVGVLVVGDAMLDAYSHGEALRVSPEAPVMVLRETDEAYVAGGAANVAINAVALGGAATLVARVGDDAEGRRLVALCADAGVDVDAVRTPLPTVVKRRLVASRHQLLRLDRDTPATDHTGVDDLVARAVARIDSADPPAVVVLSDYRKGALSADAIRAVIAAASARGITTVADPKPEDPARYAGCTLIKPNLAEAAVLWRPEDGPRPDVATPAGALALCRGALARTGARNAVLSLGERGVVAAGDQLAEPVAVPSRVREVADVSGAGDTMVAALALCLGARIPLGDAVPFANAAAGLACEKPGTAVVRLDEVVRSLEFGHRARRARMKVERDWDRLAATLAGRGDRTVVFANGVFDLLHSGHVGLLEEAADQGDILLVALNSDASTSRLKGPTRPVQREEDRLVVVAGLECVDHVTLFAQDTPLELILAVRPDVIVKGGDYAPEDVAGAREARAWGGRVHIAPLLEGRSSSNLVSRATGGGG